MEKKENAKMEQMYPIICHASSKQSTEGAAVRFSRDNREMYVPMNKPVMVPKWVYDIYLDSEWNEENRFRGMELNHLEGAE